MSGSSRLPVAELRRRHREVFLILAPPRTASTALARVFWEHPSIGFYCHEPFDACYHRSRGPQDAARELLQPLDVRGLTEGEGRSLIIKEMTFQVGDSFRDLASLTSAPIVFVIRDPRLSISSRRKKRRAGGHRASFPLVESGWDDLQTQIDVCRSQGLDYLVVDSSDLRNRPTDTADHLFRRLGLEFSESFVSWEPAPELPLGSLGAEQSHWYRRVLNSRRLQPATEPVPAVASFPVDGGLREHVGNCLELYQRLRKESRFVDGAGVRH